MRRNHKHPLAVGETVYPRQWCNSPVRGEFQDIEGKATITAPAHAAHHYLVTFEGETETCDRGPLDESSLREEIA